MKNERPPKYRAFVKVHGEVTVLQGNNLRKIRREVRGVLNNAGRSYPHAEFFGTIIKVGEETVIKRPAEPYESS